MLLTSPFLLARYAWPHLRASGDSRILVVASVHGLVASPFKAGYVAAKHGVIGLVKTLALEGAEHGIRAAALCPGYVRTPLVERQMTAQAEQRGITEDEALRDVLLEPQAIKELIEPEEVAEVAAFLLGPGGPGVHRRTGRARQRLDRALDASHRVVADRDPLAGPRQPVLLADPDALRDEPGRARRVVAGTSRSGRGSRCARRPRRRGARRRHRP